MSVEIDARGLPCPQPVIKTKDAFEKAKGTTLLVIVSTEESRDNVIRFLKHSGAEIDRTEEKAGDFYIYTKEIRNARAADINQDEYVCSLSGPVQGPLCLSIRTVSGTATMSLATT